MLVIFNTMADFHCNKTDLLYWPFDGVYSATSIKWGRERQWADFLSPLIWEEICSKRINFLHTYQFSIKEKIYVQVTKGKGEETRKKWWNWTTQGGSLMQWASVARSEVLNLGPLDSLENPLMALMVSMNPWNHGPNVVCLHIYIFFWVPLYSFYEILKEDHNPDKDKN